MGLNILVFILLPLYQWPARICRGALRFRFSRHYGFGLEGSIIQPAVLFVLLTLNTSVWFKLWLDLIITQFLHLYSM